MTQKQQIDSVLSEISCLKPELGVIKVTEYGTEELRRFARGLLPLQCPECGSKSSVDHGYDRRICDDCQACFRPEDVLVIALMKAFQAGAEDEAEKS